MHCVFFIRNGKINTINAINAEFLLPVALQKSYIHLAELRHCTVAAGSYCARSRQHSRFYQKNYVMFIKHLSNLLYVEYTVGLFLTEAATHSRQAAQSSGRKSDTETAQRRLWIKILKFSLYINNVAPGQKSISQRQVRVDLKWTHIQTNQC